MRVLYWDIFAGISGDMAFASLIALGADPIKITEQLHSLGINEFSLEITSPQIQGIQATDIDVIMLNKDNCHRHLKDIEKMINSGELPEKARINSLKVFRMLAEAEAKIHGTTIDKVHFHEVGAIDSIVDIVGTCLALEQLDIDEVRVSLLPWSRGFVTCAHGTLPLPAPATLELLLGFEFQESGVIGELITPTGAALISTLAKQTCFPQMSLIQIGYGAGKNSYGLPNLLRGVLGQIL